MLNFVQEYKGAFALGAHARQSIFILHLKNTKNKLTRERAR